MAPGIKRKVADDDFIHTVSDNEAEIVEEGNVAPPPKKKAKKTKAKQGKKQNGANETTPGPDDAEGIWGHRDDDDGAMDSDFEFMPDDNQAGLGEDLDGWGFDGAKKGMDSGKQAVDIDEIIRRRREKKGGGKATEANAANAVEEADGEEMELDLDDDEDGVLADDAFGMGEEVESEEEAGEDVDTDEDGTGADASDDESVATPVAHPDDEAPAVSDESDQEGEDPAEEARRREFFAPDEHDDDGGGGGGGGGKKQSSFQGMSLSRPILRGLAAVGFSKPTPIQAKTIPIALMGKDVVGGAVTGSGKTAAFVVPILERLLFRPKKVATSRVVILTPTRELAIQCHAVATKLAAYTDIKFSLAVGGLSLKVQEAELRLRPDVVIATPGRFIDHVRNSASFTVDTVEILVLDEADRMLEDGFADELAEIMKALPKSRQTMLFSATMTSSVDRLIRVGLDKPVRIMVDALKKTVGTLTQEFVRLRPGREGKRMGYLLYLCKNLYAQRVIVFFRQKKEAHRARIIFALMGLSCVELHGSMNQTQRISSVEAFRDGKVSYLLATDLASRGLDIKGVDTVINYEAPQTPEIYVHRVGRTARAGRRGTACTIAAEPDRKVVKVAVKAAKAQGARIASRLIEASEADELQAQVDGLADEIEEIAREEREERQMAHVEMQVKKGENIIEHADEISSRPRRTWFESERDKKTAKEAGRAELNGLREDMKRKADGRLSNKDKKKLDSKMERAGARSWKKGSAERSGRGVLMAMKSGKGGKGAKEEKGEKGENGGKSGKGGRGDRGGSGRGGGSGNGGKREKNGKIGKSGVAKINGKPKGRAR